MADIQCTKAACTSDRDMAQGNNARLERASISLDDSDDEPMSGIIIGLPVSVLQGPTKVGIAENESTAVSFENDCHIAHPNASVVQTIDLNDREGKPTGEKICGIPGLLLQTPTQLHVVERESTAASSENDGDIANRNADMLASVLHTPTKVDVPEKESAAAACDNGRSGAQRQMPTIALDDSDDDQTCAIVTKMLVADPRVPTKVDVGENKSTQALCDNGRSGAQGQDSALRHTPTIALDDSDDDQTSAMVSKVSAAKARNATNGTTAQKGRMTTVYDHDRDRTPWSTSNARRTCNLGDYEPTRAQVVGVPMSSVGASAHVVPLLHSLGNKVRGLPALKRMRTPTPTLVHAAPSGYELPPDPAVRGHTCTRVPEGIVVHSRRGLNRHINGHYLLVRPHVYKKRTARESVFLFHRKDKWHFASAVDSDVCYGYANSVMLLGENTDDALIVSPTSIEGAWQMHVGDGTFHSDLCLKVRDAADFIMQSLGAKTPTLSFHDGAVVQTLANRNVDVACIAQHLNLDDRACRRALPYSVDNTSAELPRYGRTVLICFWIALSPTFPRKQFTQSWYGWDEIRIYTISRFNADGVVLDLPFFGFAPDDHRVSIREFDLLSPAQVDKILSVRVLWAGAVQQGLAPRIALLSDLVRWMLLDRVQDEESVTNMVWFDMDVFQVAPADHFVRAVDGPDSVGIKVSTVSRQRNGGLHQRKHLHFSVEAWQKAWSWDMNMSVISYRVHSAAARDVVSRALDAFWKLHLVREATRLKWCVGIGILGRLLYDTFGTDVHKALFEPEECHPFPLQLQFGFVKVYAKIAKLRSPLAISLSGSLKMRVTVSRSAVGEPISVKDRELSGNGDEVLVDNFLTTAGKDKGRHQKANRARKRAARRLQLEQAKRRKIVIQVE